MSVRRDLQRGAILRRREMGTWSRGGCRVSVLVSPDTGSRLITGSVVEIPPGRAWPPPGRQVDRETIGVIFAGRGTARIDDVAAPVERASAIHAPSGVRYAVRADKGEPLTVYLWQSPLPPGRPTSRHPRLVSSLWNAETTFRGLASHRSPGADAPATISFVLWPGTGSVHLCLHAGVQAPGETLDPHQHADAEELFIAFEGKGQGHLDGTWHDMDAGDVLYAPPGVRHGARNPHAGAGRFVICGGPTPFDPHFYTLAGVSAEVR